MQEMFKIKRYPNIKTKKKKNSHWFERSKGKGEAIQTTSKVLSMR
jgi:hypothetical protein